MVLVDKLTMKLNPDEDDDADRSEWHEDSDSNQPKDAGSDSILRRNTD